MDLGSTRYSHPVITDDTGSFHLMRFSIALSSIQSTNVGTKYTGINYIWLTSHLDISNLDHMFDRDLIIEQLNFIHHQAQDPLLVSKLGFCNAAEILRQNSSIVALTKLCSCCDCRCCSRALRRSSKRSFSCTIRSWRSLSSG